MISAALVRVYGTLQAANWSRSKFLRGDVSVETSEKYLGYKQPIRNAVNDRIGHQAVSLI
jgi:hypothetical protein